MINIDRDLHSFISFLSPAADDLCPRSSADVCDDLGNDSAMVGIQLPLKADEINLSQLFQYEDGSILDNCASYTSEGLKCCLQDETKVHTLANESFCRQYITFSCDSKVSSKPCSVDCKGNHLLAGCRIQLRIDSSDCHPICLIITFFIYLLD